MKEAIAEECSFAYCGILMTDWPHVWP